MAPGEILYERLVSNFEELGNISEYFDQGTICNDGKSISELKSDIVYHKDGRSCKGSVCTDEICYPSPNISLSDASIVSDINSNNILISILLDHDEVGKGFQKITNVIKCKSGKYNVTFDVYPIGIDNPSRLVQYLDTKVNLDELNRPSVVPMKSKTVTLGIKFITMFIENICKSLLDSTRYFNFTHGNLTHESIGFKDGKPIICDLRYSSMTFTSNNKIVRLEPKVSTLRKVFRSTFIPSSNMGFYEIGSEKNMNGVSYYRSIDYYTLILSCLSIDYFFNTVMSNYVMKTIILDSLFDTLDISNVYKSLLSAVERGKTLEYAEILSILRPCKLRCNAIELTLDRLNKLKNNID